MIEITLNALDVGKFLNHYLHMRYRKGFMDGFTFGDNEGYETGYDEGLKEGVTIKKSGHVVTINSFGRVL